MRKSTRPGNQSNWIYIASIIPVALLLVFIWWFIISPFAWWPLPGVLVATAVIAFTAAEYYSRQHVYYSGALVAMAPEAILVAALSTALSYMGTLYPPNMPFTPPVFAVFIGLAIGLVFWLLSAVVYCFFHLSAADGANYRSYGQLRQRLSDLESRLEVLCTGEARGLLLNRAAAEQALACSRSVRAILYPKDLTNAALANIDPASVFISSTNGKTPALVPVSSTGELLPTGAAGEAATASTTAAATRLYDPVANGDSKEHGNPKSSRVPQDGQRLEGLQWVLGHGYITLWQLIHDAEEALIEIEDPEELVGYILHDKSRLDDSTITHREELIDVLKRASHNLSVSAAAYVDTTSNQKDTPPPSRPPTSSDDKQARAALRQVRRMINEFRDDRWDGLVQHRNYLMVALLLTHIVAYTLMGVCILVGASIQAILAGSVYFMVGTMVGLFNRLRLGPGAHSEIDDYGLNHARLIATPVFSGVAAVCGVVLFALVPSLLNVQALAPQGAAPTPTPTAAAHGLTNRVDAVAAIAPASLRSYHALSFSAPLALADTPTPSATLVSSQAASPTPISTLSPTPTLTPKPAATPTPTATPSPWAPPTHFPPLGDIFALDRNLFALVIAATFGLAPSALIRALQKQTDSYKLDLSSTEAQDSSPN